MLVGRLIVCAAFVLIGLTAPADGYSIGAANSSAWIRRRSPNRAPALARRRHQVRTAHLHFKWSAIPLTPATTNSPGTLF
jgi:hypothetical protein